VDALIVGVSRLMRIETSFRILGYPGLAMLLFLIAPERVSRSSSTS
jgi:hypothetical protein